MLRSLALAVGVLFVGGLASHSDAKVQGQSQSVSITITSSSAEAIRFRGALIFEQGGFQSVEGVTPMEVRVRLSTGRSEGTGTAGRVMF